MNRHYQFITLIFLVCVVAVVTPFCVYASVVINEIDWMGNSTSANNEWIELKNTDTEPVSLTGWTLVAEDGSPSITLSGTIASAGYYLLERSDDDSAPDNVADLIYTGSLGNTGETLALNNENGETVDSVLGGESWKNIGGDKDTFMTAQHTVNGWITANPTPGGQNASVEQTSPDSNSPSGTFVTPSSPEHFYHSYPNSSALLPQSKTIDTSTQKDAIEYQPSIESNRNPVIAGSLVTFTTDASEDSVCQWNFGDGSMGYDRDAVHTYQYSGKYIVVLDVQTGDRSTVTKTTIIVIDSPLTISKKNLGSNGFITVGNNSEYELDISSWSLRSGSNIFLIPKHTYILPHNTITFSAQTMGFGIISDTHLLYPNGKEVEPVKSQKANTISVVKGSVNHSVSGEVLGVSTAHDDVVKNEITTNSSSSDPIQETNKKTSIWWWILALAALITFALLSLFFITKETRKKDEFDIIES